MPMNQVSSVAEILSSDSTYQEDHCPLLSPRFVALPTPISGGPSDQHPLVHVAVGRSSTFEAARTSWRIVYTRLQVRSGQI